jgi:class 3 adenylate cyclase
MGVPLPTGGIANALVNAWESGVVTTLGWPFFLPRIIGLALLVGGDPSTAARWLRQAVDRAHALGAPGEAARSKLDLARALVRGGGDRAEAPRLLAEAAAELDRLGMVPFVIQARRLAWQAGSDLPEDDIITRYILVTDLVGSTELNVRAGDRVYLRLLGEHDRVIRTLLRRYDGVEFKHTGDGICAWFQSPNHAASCATRIQAEMDHVNVLHPDLPLRVRAGIAAGKPLGHSGDLFGLPVVIASRVCALGGPGDVLLTDDVAGETTGLRLTSIGPTALKGLPAPYVLHRAAGPEKRDKG